MLRTQQKYDNLPCMKKNTIQLYELPFFEGIRTEHLPSLLACLKGHEKSYKKGELIYLEEDEIKNVGIVLEGTVLMQKEDLWGNQTLLAYMNAGELFGETFAVRKEEKQSYGTFEAATDCRILFMSFHHILHTCQNACNFHQRVIVNMMMLVTQKNVKLMEKIEITSKGSLRDKLLTYLSIQSQKQGSNQVQIGINRTQLADYLDSNRSAMTRELSLMKSEGIIDFDKNSFTILNL